MPEICPKLMWKEGKFKINLLSNLQNEIPGPFAPFLQPAALSVLRKAGEAVCRRVWNLALSGSRVLWITYPGCKLEMTIPTSLNCARVKCDVQCVKRLP